MVIDHEAADLFAWWRCVRNASPAQDQRRLHLVPWNKCFRSENIFQPKQAATS
jgi:hypothetical protein